MDEWGTQIEPQYSNQIRKRKGGSWKPALSSWPLRFCVGTEAPLGQREPGLNSLGQNTASREGYGIRAGPGTEPFRHKRMTVSLHRASGRMRSLTSHTSVFPVHPGIIQRAGKLRCRPGRKQGPAATASREADAQSREPRLLPGTAGSPRRKCRGCPGPAPWRIPDQ